MFLRVLISFFCVFLLLGCEKPNPNPENIDPIYADLQKRQAEAHSQVEGAKKDLESHEKELQDAVPQTGQNKYALKRIEETKEKLNHLEQMELYYEFHVKSRLKDDRISYLKAYKAKKPWPPPEEIEAYEATKRLEEAPRTWDARARLQQAKQDLGVDMSFQLGRKASPGGAEKAAAPKKEE
jgi:hypothetical protein